MSFYNKFAAIFGRSISSRFPLTLAPVNDLLKELRPQLGQLEFFSESGAVMVLDTTPQKFQQFSDAKFKNTEIVPNALTNDITIVNPDGFGARIILNVQINTGADAHLIVEIYADDVATGILFNFSSENQIISQTDVLDLEVPNGVVLTFYGYLASGSVTATLRKLSFTMEKIALYADSTVLVVAAEPEVIYTVKNTDGTPIKNTDGDIITT